MDEDKNEPRNGLTTFSGELGKLLKRFGDRRQHPERCLPEGPRALTVLPKQLPKVMVTPEQIVAHLIGLEMMFPFPQRSEQEVTLKYRLFLEDLKHLTNEELSLACRRYRTDHRNKFFPTSGQLLHLARGF